MNYLRKSITFKSNDPTECDVYNMLDKIRYHQSDFIIKLVLDFCKRNGINKDTPYKYLKMVIQSYIDGSLPQDQTISACNVPLGTPVNYATQLNNLSELFQQMYIPALMQQLNNNMGWVPPGNGNIATNNFQRMNTSPNKNNFSSFTENVAKTDIKIKGNDKENEIQNVSLVDSKSTDAFEIQDEDDDVSDIQGMAMGFQSLYD